MQTLVFKPITDKYCNLPVGGCLGHAYVSEDKKTTILLRKRYHITGLIIKHYHIPYSHADS